MRFREHITFYARANCNLIGTDDDIIKFAKMVQANKISDLEMKDIEKDN